MFGGGGGPILVLSQNTRRESGRKVQIDNVNAAKMIADVIRTCLGPRAMLKWLSVDDDRRLDKYFDVNTTGVYGCGALRMKVRVEYDEVMRRLPPSVSIGLRPWYEKMWFSQPGKKSLPGIRGSFGGV